MASLTGLTRAAATEPPRYEKRDLTYANSFENRFQKVFIQAVEWLTGKLSLVRMVHEFERRGGAKGLAFWGAALDVMGIELQTPEAQIRRIPKDGPLVIVANHPHGLVDGMVLAEIVGRVRTDYKILTRSLLTGVAEIDQFMLPVAFAHEDDSVQQNIEMRRLAMEHLGTGGTIILFPSGRVAASDTFFGPAIEGEWNPFTAKMIRRSGAQVVPIYFPGQNSRYYQIANKFSATLRQGLLLHEVVYALNKPQRPVVGEAIGPDTIADWQHNSRGFVAWLRDRTLALKAEI
jgi:putative hemolysin